MRILIASAVALALAGCGETATEDETADDVAAAEESEAAEAIDEGADGAADAESLEDADADAEEAPEPEKAVEKAPEKADNWQRITIDGFECGDNCYLVYTPAGGNESESALCEARACDPWFEMQEMPPEYIGRQVRVQFGSGQQVDGSGNVMSEDFPSITKIRM